MSHRHNEQFKQKLLHIVAQFYPQINLKIIFVNNLTISSMFPFKDPIPDDLKSNVVYKFKCGICNSTYIGETTRHFKTRVAEHMGISPRTGKPVKNPKSNVYKHFQDSGHPIHKADFSIIGNIKSWDTKLLESILIHVQKPNLNGMATSTPLNVLG